MVNGILHRIAMPFVMLGMPCGCAAKRQAPIENVPSLYPPEPVLGHGTLPAPKAIDAPPTMSDEGVSPAVSAQDVDLIVNIESNRNCLGDPKAFLRDGPTTRGVE